jgi:putative chitinase
VGAQYLKFGLRSAYPRKPKMNIQEFIDLILNPLPNGQSANIRSDYGVPRDVGTTPHVGIDLNYPGGPSSNPAGQFAVHSPVEGKVTAVIPRLGLIQITTPSGYKVELLHTQTRSVATGDTVHPGSVIGTMGGVGAPGGSVHVHTQVRPPGAPAHGTGATVNPRDFAADFEEFHS